MSKTPILAANSGRHDALLNDDESIQIAIV